jgi:hypothetical protein
MTIGGESVVGVERGGAIILESEERENDIVRDHVLRIAIGNDDADIATETDHGRARETGGTVEAGLDAARTATEIDDVITKNVPGVAIGIAMSVVGARTGSIDETEIDHDHHMEKVTDERTTEEPNEMFQLGIASKYYHDYRSSRGGANSPANPDQGLADLLRRVLHQILIELHLALRIQHNHRTSTVQECAQTLPSLDFGSRLNSWVVSDTPHQHGAHSNHRNRRSCHRASQNHHRTPVLTKDVQSSLLVYGLRIHGVVCSRNLCNTFNLA